MINKMQLSESSKPKVGANWKIATKKCEWAAEKKNPKGQVNTKEIATWVSLTRGTPNDNAKNE